MTVTTMEILGRGGEKRPTLQLDRQTADALATYCEIRWPVGRRKAVMAEWDLSNEEARSVIEAVASKRIIDSIWKHERGGWRVILPVLGAVVGQSVHEHFRAEIKEAAREQQQLEDHARLAEAARSRLSLGDALRPGGDRIARREGRQGRRAGGSS